MWRTSLAAVLLTAGLSAQAPAPQGPQLEPGEGLAIGQGEQTAFYGEADREYPMGSLAKLVWLRMEGTEWAAIDARFTCTGELNGVHCWKREGHGKVDLGKALLESCNLAFLAWARWSVQRWSRESGEGSARVRIEEGFRPFLGNRMPAGDTLPQLGPEWIGDGTLLRTSPKAMLAWLMDPLNEGLSDQAMRYLRPVRGLFSRSGEDWWMKTGTAPVPGDPGATSAWVAGSDGVRYAVLHLPRGRGKAEGQARFKALMGIKK
jgi:hypothetical protein